MAVEPEPIVTNEQDEQRVTSEDIEFVFDTMKKEAPFDEASLRQLFYGCSSAFTKTPLHHNVNSRKTGAGKTYDLMLVVGYYPDRFVLRFIGMSDKALMHEQGIGVIVDDETGNTIPIDPVINEKQMQINELEYRLEDPKLKAAGATYKKQIKELENEIKELSANSEKLIDLNNRIIILLDTPQEGLYNALMSLASQDTVKDQIYQFAEKNSSGKMGSPRNRLRGTPAIFTTQVIDDTRQVRYQEKNRRFIHVTPNTSTQKVHSARSLIGKKFGLLPDEYDDHVVSAEDQERAKDIVSRIVEKLTDHSKLLKPKESGVRIPFTESIAEGIGGDETEWSMTVMDRLMKYLSIITKVNMDSRPRIENTETGAFYPISIFADLKEALKLMEMAGSALRPYIANWYNRAFLPAYRELEGPNASYDNYGKPIETEKYEGLTTEQLAYWTQKYLNITLNTDEIRRQFIYPLRNTGMINSVKSIINGNETICYPVEEGNIFSIFTNDKDLRLEVPLSLYPSKRVLEENLRTFVNHDVREKVQENKKFDKYRLVDHEGNAISLQKLIDRYLSDPWTCFTNGEIKAQAKARNLCMYGDHPTRNNNFIPQCWRRHLTRIQKNPIEESSSSDESHEEEVEDSRYDVFCDPKTTELAMGFDRTWSIRKNGRYWTCDFSPDCANFRGIDKWAMFGHGKVHEIAEVKEKLGVLQGFDSDTQKKELGNLSKEQLDLLLAHVEHYTPLQKAMLIARDYLIDGERI
jgi:hypothetical protein